MTPELWARMIVAIKQWNAKRQRRSAASRKGWANPEARKKASASGTERWANASPEQREQWIAATTEALNRPEIAKKLVEVQAILSNDPEVRSKRSAGRKKAWSTEKGLEERKRAKDRKKKEWQDPEKAKRMREAMKSPHPEAHENRSAAMAEVSARPEVAKGRRERQKEWWDTASPEEREQRVAAMHAADSDPDVVGRRNASIKETLGRPEAVARRRTLSRAMWANPDMVQRIQAGRLKAARRLIAGPGRTPLERNAEAMRIQDEEGLSIPQIVDRWVREKKIAPPKDEEARKKLIQTIEKGARRRRKKLGKRDKAA